MYILSYFFEWLTLYAVSIGSTPFFTIFTSAFVITITSHAPESPTTVSTTGSFGTGVGKIRKSSCQNEARGCLSAVEGSWTSSGWKYLRGENVVGVETATGFLLVRQSRAA